MRQQVFGSTASIYTVEALAGSGSFAQTHRLHVDISTKLKAADQRPDVAVELSRHIPALLDTAAQESTNFLNGKQSWVVPPVGKGLQPWQDSVRLCIGILNALRSTSRLPHQDVLDTFKAPGAGAHHVAWIDNLAGRVLAHRQAPPRRRTRGSSLPEDPLWEDVADDLVGLACRLLTLHNQCMLAVQQAEAAAPSAPSAAGHHSSSRGGGGGRGSRRGGGRAEPSSAGSVAALGGGTWTWRHVVSDLQDDLSSAVALQVLAAWLRPNLLRLAHALLLRSMAPGARGMVALTTACDWVSTLLSVHLHPGLLQVGIGTSPKLAAVMTAVGSKRPDGLQDLAWGYVAAGSQVLRQAVLPLVRQRPVAATLLHPALRRCPAYHKERSYAGWLVNDLGFRFLFLSEAARCEQRLLAAELWDLGPWQMQVLQRHKHLQQEHTQQQEAARSTGARGASSSSSSRVHHNTEMYYLVSWPLLPPALPLLRSSYISTSRLPAPPKSQQPPVTQQQLQLALELVCVTVELSPQDTRSSLMLLVLLLLRAELPQRLAFLQGPWGGLLLAALQLYACDRLPLHVAVEAAAPGLAPEEDMAWRVSCVAGDMGFAEMLLPLLGRSSTATGSSAGWALSWLLLQPQDSGGAIPKPSSSSSSSSGSTTTASTSSSSSTIIITSTSTGGSNAGSGEEELWQLGAWVHLGRGDPPAGGLPRVLVPETRLQLLPRYTPDMQLLCTLETLFDYGHADLALLLDAMAAAYQEDPSRAPPPTSPMWVRLAGLAVSVRQSAASLHRQLPDLGAGQRTQGLRSIRAVLPLLRLAGIALQQPGAGGRALVLASAVQGAVLACCSLAVAMSADEVAALAEGAGLRENRSCSAQSAAPTTAAAAHHLGVQLINAYQPNTIPDNPQPAAAAAASSSSAGLLEALLQVLTPGKKASSKAKASGAKAAAAAAGGGWRSIPSVDHEREQLMSALHGIIPQACDLLTALRSAWPGSGTGAAVKQACAAGTAAAAAAAQEPAVAAAAASPPAAAPEPAATGAAAAAAAAAAWNLAQSLPDDVMGSRNHKAYQALRHLASLLDVCQGAEGCLHACRGRVQLLGCANLGCGTLPPAGGLSFSQDGLAVNCKGSVCGGCGVVRYCSAACAQQDWPGHRRVCRRLAAAAAASKDQQA